VNKEKQNLRSFITS